MDVLIGPRNPEPPGPLIAGLCKKRGGCVRDVKDESVVGAIMPGLLDVRCDQGESLIAKLASLTFLCKGFIAPFTWESKSPMLRPSPVLAAASSPQAYKQ
jgi:hypothetical protein